MRRGLLLSVGGLLLGSCKSSILTSDQDIPPPVVFVLLDRQGTNLLTSSATPLTVSFCSNTGQRIYMGSECAGGGCTMIRQAPGTAKAPKYQFYYQSLGMAQLSTHTFQTFYLELGGQIDTLRCYVPLPSTKALMERSRPTTLIFNGQHVAIDPAQLPVYPLRRR